MKERQPVNYIYFGFLFLIISVLHIYHVFLIESATGLHRFFYSIHALGQCLGRSFDLNGRRTFSG